MKELSKTKVTVRLRKVEDRKEWYVYIESYPVFVPGKKTHQRIREYLNRSVTTVEWDKKRTARTEADGTKTYKPKRDDNGIIVCRSEKDQESMLYADVFVNFANGNTTMPIYTARPKAHKPNKRSACSRILLNTSKR
jgi:hypothetical protein